MHVKEKTNQIILTDRAGCVWLLCLLFIFVGGTILYGALGGFTNWHEVRPWVLVVSALMGMLGLFVGFSIIFATPIATVILNRKTGTLLHRRRGLVTTDERVIHFAEIEEFFVVEEKDHEGDWVYRIDMKMKSGEELRLTQVMEPVKEDNEALALRLNEYIC